MAIVEVDFRNILLKEVQRGLFQDIDRCREFCREFKIKISRNKEGLEIISQTDFFGIRNELQARRRAGVAEEVSQRGELGSPNSIPSIT